jgi:hypothetical protein
LTVNIVQVDVKFELDVDLVLGTVLVLGFNREGLIVVAVGIHVEARYPELADLFFDFLLS